MIKKLIQKIDKKLIDWSTAEKKLIDQLVIENEMNKKN